MPVIVVERPGLLTTIQDLGRPGYGPIGVSACGAADPVALRVGNKLLGNPDGAPALEMTMAGGAFRFPEGAQIALSGSLFESNHTFWRTHTIHAGGCVNIGRALNGARCYLCVRGGVNVPLTLGSASTHVVSGLGGSPLHTGRHLPIGPEPPMPARRSVRRSALEAFAAPEHFGVTPGPQHHWLGMDLTSAEYQATARSNRTGIRLAGPRLPVAPHSMITEGASLGAIQVPPDGQPIILFVDAQTTGGYPVVANVIAAHLPHLGQLRPGDRVQFEWISFEHARRLYIEQQRLLDSEQLLW